MTNTISAFDTSCDMRVRMIKCRDGVRLHTAIYFPEDFDGTPLPALLIRTPYCSGDRLLLPDKRVAEQKIIYIVQSCRGTGFSEGNFDPTGLDTEKNDVEDLFLWLDKQSWFNGRCAMFGGSYTGWVQWCAARTGWDGLVAISPKVAPLYACLGGTLKGGGIRHELVINWVLNLYHRRKFGFSNLPDYEKMGVLTHLPLSDCDCAAGYAYAEPFHNIISNMETPGKLLDFHKGYFPELKVPALVSGGWFDPFRDETIESFLLMKSSAATEKARKLTRLYIGPWEHAGLVNPDLFGAENNQDELIAIEERFLHGLMSDPDTDPVPDIPVVRYFMVGENRWRDADTWPPAGVQSKNYYLHSNGKANTLDGDGVLSEDAPGNEKFDTYISDPANPALSCGGKCLPLGCYDRSEDEKRTDTLVYTTKPVDKALTLAGKVEFHFHASASTPDTDFCAVLTMVTPEGKSLFLSVGEIRARFRNSRDQAELLVPGEIYEYTIDLSHIAVKLEPGYALRLEVCGHYFPLFGRNPNTGKELKDDTELISSTHCIYHDAAHPSLLVLPVMAE